MDIVAAFIPPVLVGLFVGILSGMLGVGGGTILVPVFKLGFDMAPIACTATSLFTIIPTSISGAITHIRNRTCIPRLGIVIGLGGAVTSPVGVWLASISPYWAIMVASAIVILYSSYTMLRKAIRMGSNKGGKAKPAPVAAKGGESENPGASNIASVGSSAASKAANTDAASGGNLATTSADAQITPRVMAMGVAIGLIAGSLSGYVGLGGGFLIIPLMMQFMGTTMKVTGGTSLIAVMILVIPGVAYQAMLGNVAWIIGICVACGSIPGAVIGSHLMNYVPERALRFFFAGFLMVAAVLLIVDQFGVI